MRTVGVGAAKPESDSTEELKKENKSLKSSNTKLKNKIEELEEKNEALHEENESLRAENATLKENAIFQICNFLYTNQAGLSGKAVSSVNNNGYSESYALQNKEQLMDSMREMIYDCIGTRLAGVF